jgi:hypothetical protein
MDKLEGTLQPQEIEALAKTASVGFGQALAPQLRSGVAAMAKESLDTVVKTLTFDKQHFVLWNKLNRKSSASLVDQYILKPGYGAAYQRASFLEGGSPVESDSIRFQGLMKKVFYGARRRITLQATMVQTVQDIVAEYRNDMVMQTMREIERDLWSGNDMFVDASGFARGQVADMAEDIMSISGLISQVRAGENDPRLRSDDFAGFGAAASAVADSAASTLQQDDLEADALAVHQQFGRPKMFLTSPEVLSAYNKQFYPKERSQLVAAADRSGFAMKLFDSSVGAIELSASHFVRPKEDPASSSRQVAPQSPSAPSISLSAGAAPSGAPGLAAATYFYRVASVNIHGEGLPSAASSQAATAGQAITVAITAPGSGPTPRAYAVYRGSSASNCKFVGYIKANMAGAASFVDNGSISPGLSKGLMADLDPQVSEIIFLGNEMNQNNLAEIQLSKELICFSFLNLIVYQPAKMRVRDNIAK